MEKILAQKDVATHCDVLAGGRNVNQQALWHESPEDALRSLVDALGGFKKIGVDLWPALKADVAGRRLADCLNPERDHNLEPRELLLLLRWGRDKGCHVAMHFICSEVGYQAPEPLNPTSEQERLQREFIAAAQTFERLSTQMQKAGVRWPS